MKTAGLNRHIQKSPLLFFVIYLLLSWFTTIKMTNEGFLVQPLSQLIYIDFVAIAFLAVWYLLTKLYVLSQGYAKKIKGSREQPAFLALSRGSLGLYVSLLLTAFLNSARIPSVNETVYKNLTIAVYYSAGLIALYFFYQFGRAGQIFAKYVNKSQAYYAGSFIFGLLLSIICYYAWKRITGVYADNIYNSNQILNYLSAKVVLYTLFLPLLVMWSYGLAGAFGIYLYLRHSGGIIYKRAFEWLSGGAVTLVIVSIFRHISDYVSGSPSQLNLIQDFPRIVVLFSLVIFASFAMFYGVSKLDTFERPPKKT